MPAWHCRHATAPAYAVACRGPGHRECGLRYTAGEFRVTADGVWLDDIGTVRINGTPPKAPSAVIVFKEGGNWVAEFEAGEQS